MWGADGNWFGNSLEQALANIFHKGPDSKYLGISGAYDLCHNSSTLCG